MAPRTDVKRRLLECALNHEPLIKVLPIPLIKWKDFFFFYRNLSLLVLLSLTFTITASLSQIFVKGLHSFKCAFLYSVYSCS